MNHTEVWAFVPASLFDGFSLAPRGQKSERTDHASRQKLSREPRHEDVSVRTRFWYQDVVGFRRSVPRKSLSRCREGERTIGNVGEIPRRVRRTGYTISHKGKDPRRESMGSCCVAGERLSWN